MKYYIRIPLTIFVLILLSLGDSSLREGAQAAQSSWVGSIGFSWSKEEEVRGVPVESARVANLWLGVPHSIAPDLGFYINAGMPSSVWESRNVQNFNDYWYFNSGLTYSLNKKLLVYAGPGIAYQRVRGFRDIDTEHRTRANANIGFIFHFTERFGVNLGYDSAPSSLSIGITINSSTFQ